MPVIITFVFIVVVTVVIIKRFRKRKMPTRTEPERVYVPPDLPQENTISENQEPEV